MFCAPSGAKEKKQEDKKPAKTVKVASDLKPNRSYNIKSGDVVWTISDDTTKVVGLKTTIQKKDKKNALQQFAFVSTNGSTFYLYNIGAKAFVGKDGALSQTPNNPIKIKEGKKKGEITLSFADTLVFQTAKKGKVLILDKVPQKGDNALVEITFAQEFNPVQATSLVEDVNYQREVSHGLFNVKKGANNEWFWDIPDSLIGRRILLTVRFTGTPAGTQKYGGELVKQQTVYWELSPKNELLLRAEALMNVADSASAINRAVEVSSINPIMASFKVIHHKKGLRRINVTPLFNADDAAMGFSTSQKQNFGLSGFNPNLSYIESIKTFPMNTEVRTVKTWGSATAKNLAGARAGKVTIGLNYSFVLLPSDLMQRRYFDPRVGYFADRFVRFSDNQQRVENERFIVRYRLEPKDSADAERMKRGELIEPKKQIVYYIDPATPKQWRKYLIQGVNDWQKAFEQAGWKNAIVGKEWPENDPSMSLEDARFSVIRYLASDIPNAYGPNVHDPRTGEIIESHVCWYHNVMTLVHDWYMVQAANIDEAARKMNFDEELMGELIRFVSSHEVGHSMGLRHNFGSSSTVPVDSLRNKAWVEKFGHTPSIMDYARFNYVAQPEDSISRLGIFPRIGDYDTWAIEWGYRPMFAPNAQADHEALEQLFKEKHDKNPRLWFGDGETNKTNDSRCLTEDLGDDAIKASEYGILNLKRSIKNLQAWSYDKKDIYNTNLKTIYESHLTQLVRYTNHVIRNLGGVYANFKTIDQEGDVYSYVSRERHKEVMEYVSRNIATEPTWLIAEPYVKRFHPTPQSITENFGKTAMTSLLNACGQLTEVYTPSEYLTDLRKMLFTEATTGSRVSAYRQTLQRAFVSTLCAELKTMSVNNKLQAPFLATLRQLKTQLQNAGADSETRAHFAALTFTIEQALKPNL
ncbi:MAG: zinc-dependent metalloprotease [Bacteroidaceae bacterium]|nr:zinc-dependent metalloprotease [Bacteroidaceae bacterium]